MKNGTHPNYNEKITITCNSCKTTFQAGSTASEINVEVCSHCHPFYTGQTGQLVDTDNLVDKFRKRTEAANSTLVIKKRAKINERNAKTSEISSAPSVTLKDMLRGLQN